jgi:hypothetical protein
MLFKMVSPIRNSPDPTRLMNRYRMVAIRLGPLSLAITSAQAAMVLVSMNTYPVNMSLV